MSEITEVKTAIKRVLSIFEEIKKDTDDYLPKLSNYPADLSTAVENFEQTKTANVKKIEANVDEIQSLKKKKSDNNREILNLEEENKNLTENRHDLSNKIENVNTHIKDLEAEITTKRNEITNREQRLHELETNVHQMTSEQEKFEERMKNLEAELQEEYDKKLKYANSFENRVKAMKLLVTKNYLKTSQVQLLSALQVGTELDLKNILQAYDIKMDTATKILRKIVELGGPIDFNEPAGKVTLKTEVDFK